MSVPRVLVVGAGHMGSAIIRGLLAGQGSFDVCATDADPRVLDAARGEGVGTVALSDLDTVVDASAIVLAVPPQRFDQLVTDHPGLRATPGVVISVMAGITVARMQAALRTEQIVRAIPNTPSEILEGTTGYFCHASITDENETLARRVLDSFGMSVAVADEALIDPLTALFGGGPAFVARYVHVLATYGEHIGLSASEARHSVLALLRGTVDLIERTDRAPLQVCTEVMTPGGTTEQGIRALDVHGFDDAVSAGLRAASARSVEIGGRN